MQQPGVKSFGRREWNYLALLGLAFLGIYFFNYIFLQVDVSNEQWRNTEMLPTYGPPVGVDFYYLHESGKKLLQEGITPYNSLAWYPPFTFLFFAPFSWLPYYAAYFLQIIITTLMLLFSIALLLRISLRLFSERTGIDSPLLGILAFYIGTLVSLQLLSSYPYAYAVERGNNDAYTIFFIVVALWLMIEKPQKMWWPILCITAATHIKIYPAVFFLMIFWQHRWRCLLPIILLNLLAVFSMGGRNAFEWFHWLGAVMETYTAFTPLNHSMSSFVASVFCTMMCQCACPTWVVKAAGLIPLSLWAISVFILVRRGFCKNNALLFLCISVPLMNLLPATSNDYKIILVYPILAVLLLMSSAEFLFERKRAALWASIVLVVISSLLSFNVLIAKEIYSIGKYMNPFTTSKTPALLLLQMIMIFWLFNHRDKACRN